MLSAVGDLDGAADCLKAGFVKNQDSAEMASFLGMLHERLGSADQARSLYETSLRICQMRLQRSRKLSDAENEIVMYLMVGKKDGANVRLQALVRESANNAELKSFTKDLDTFDRRAYIENILRPHSSHSRIGRMP